MSDQSLQDIGTSPGGGSQCSHYWCFISYRHADNLEQDREWASWLHQEIERYEVPAELVGTLNQRGDIIPERIYPVFRDEESLSADADLGSSIRQALDDSRFLVVLCSPRAVASRYVAQEILHFKQSGKKERILAAIIAGQPSSGEKAVECFPQPLRHRLKEDGSLDISIEEEPIAADFRLPDESEGFTSSEAWRLKLCSEAHHSKREVKKLADRYDARLRLMKLKIIAGILGVPLEILRDRDKAFQLELARKRARTLRLWLVAVGVLAIAAAVGGFVANEQKNRAQTARNAADEVIQTMLYDLRDELIKADLSLLHEKINAVAREYFTKFPPQHLSDSERYEQASALGTSAYNFLKLGQAEDALEAANQSVKICESIAERNPDEEYQTHLAVSYGVLGEVLLRSKGPDAARDWFRKSLKIDQSIFDQQLSRDELDHNAVKRLAISHQNLGGIEAAIHGAGAALEDYEKSYALIAVVYGDDPGTDNLRDLGIIHERLGETVWVTDGAAAALEHFQKNLEISQDLFDKEPHPQNKRSLAISHLKIGDVKLELDGPSAALPHFQEDLKLSSELYSRESSATNAHAIGISHQKMANVIEVLNGVTAALDDYRKSHSYLKKLYDQEPTTQNAHALAVACQFLGDALKVSDGPDAALVQYQEFNRIISKLHTLEPNSENTRSLAFSLGKLGEAKQATGELETAKSHYLSMHQWFDSLYEDHKSTQAAKDLSLASERLGEIEMEMGNAEAAWPYFERYQQLSSELFGEDASAQNARDLAISNLKLGEVKLALGDPVAALGYLEKDLELSGELYAGDPSAQNIQNLATSHLQIADLKMELEGPETAIPHYSSELKLIELLSQKDPGPANKQSLAVSYFHTGEAEALLAAERNGSEQTELRISARLHFEQGRALLQELADQDELDYEGKSWLGMFDEQIGRLISLPELQRLREKYLKAFRKSPRAPESLIPIERTLKQLIGFYTRENDWNTTSECQNAAISVLLEANLASNPSVAGEAGIEKLSDAYGELCWFQILAQQFDQAVQSGQKAVELLPRVWVEGNLAHAFLFSGNWEQARTLYKKNLNQPLEINDWIWEEAVEADFSEFREHGINHPDMEKAERLLGL